MLSHWTSLGQSQDRRQRPSHDLPSGCEVSGDKPTTQTTNMGQERLFTQAVRQEPVQNTSIFSFPTFLAT